MAFWINSDNASKFPGRWQPSLQDGGAATSGIPLVAAPPSCKDGCHLPGNFDALSELIQKAIDDGDYIHIPGIEISPFRCVL